MKINYDFQTIDKLDGASGIRFKNTQTITVKRELL